MTQFIKVVQCGQDFYWYKNRIGHILPVVGESQHGYMIDIAEMDSKNKPAVMKEDAVPVENVFTYLVTYEFQPEGKPSMKQQTFAFTEKPLTSPSMMKVYMRELRKEVGTEAVYIAGLLDITHLSDKPKRVAEPGAALRDFLRRNETEKEALPQLVLTVHEKHRSAFRVVSFRYADDPARPAQHDVYKQGETISAQMVADAESDPQIVVVQVDVDGNLIDA